MELPAEVRQRVEELKNKLAGAGEPGERISLLLRLCEELMVVAPEEAEPFGTEAARLAEECRDFFGLARAAKMLGDLAFLRGDIALGQKFANQVMEAARAINNRRLEGSGYYLLGVADGATGRFDKARENYEKALHIWEAEEFPEGVTAALNQLGGLFVTSGQPGKALSCYQECLKRSLAKKETYPVAIHNYNVGLTLVLLGRWEEAAEHLYRAIALSEQHGFEGLRCNALNTLGELFLKRDRPDRAIEMFQTVIAAGRRKAIIPDLFIDALANLGEAYFRKRDLASASKVYAEALAVCAESGNRLGEAALHWRMAELELANGQLERAESLAFRAYELASALGLQREEAEALRVQAQVLAERGDMNAARQRFEQALGLLANTEESYELARLRLQFGRCLFRAGMNQEAVEQLRKAARVFRMLATVAEAEEANRYLFRLELTVDQETALLQAVAGLAALGQDAAKFLDQALRLLREGLLFTESLLMVDSRPLLVHGSPDIDKARALSASPEPQATGTSLYLPVRAGNIVAGCVFLERTEHLEQEHKRAVLQTLGNLLFGAVQELAAAKTVPEPPEIAGLQYAGVIGRNPVMLRNLAIVKRVAGATVPVLIRGESGTGKELIARALHASGPRMGKPFVAVNCAAMPEQLLEAEFFGVEKGAATGVVARKGKLESADGGTVFLDEIGDMSPALQAKLLRVLQEKEFERVGGRVPIKVDVRIVAATNKDLAGMIDQGLFRKDLYYRLNAVELVLPPLRERREDIPELVRFFITRSSREFQRPVTRVSPEVMAIFLAYDWPGNIRELQNVIERAVILA
ncbi:MAG: sigma 54-interacting transcriptional regulator, partial [candidate division WOR-3 bacterium]